MNQDLTQGKPSCVLRRFCLPLFVSVVFQQLYNLADSFVAGRFIGENALAAVGNSYELTLVYIAFAFGCSIGCSVVVAHLFGARRIADLKTAVWTTCISCVVLCVAMMAIGLWCGKSMLHLINTPEDIFDDSWLYLNIYILGVPFLMFYNVANGIFAAMGDSRTPFFFLAVSSMANIGMDILFVSSLGMGVSGVAWATFLCQGISCILAMGVIGHRLNSQKTPIKIKYFSVSIFLRLAAIAIPSILQQVFISVGNIIIQGKVNSCGTGIIAGYAASVKMNNLVITAFTTLGNGVSSFTAQNMGAGNIRRVRDGFIAGLKLVWMLCVPISLSYFLCAGSLMDAFLDKPTETAFSTGTLFLRLLSPFYAVIAAKLVADGVLRGAGKMNFFMIATFTDLMLRVLLAYYFCRFWGAMGIWLAWPVGWTVSTALSICFTLKVFAYRVEVNRHIYVK